MKRRLGDRYRVTRRPYRVDYFWIENGTRHEAHTVENGVDLADAERRFQNRARHVTVYRPAAKGGAS